MRKPIRHSMPSHTGGVIPTEERQIYQGRFKSLPVQSDKHFVTVARYVERNALRANLVERAQDWRWSSSHAARSRQAAELRNTVGGGRS